MSTTYRSALKTIKDKDYFNQKTAELLFASPEQIQEQMTAISEEQKAAIEERQRKLNLGQHTSREEVEHRIKLQDHKTSLQILENQRLSGQRYAELQSKSTALRQQIEEARRQGALDNTPMGANECLNLVQDDASLNHDLCWDVVLYNRTIQLMNNLQTLLNHITHPVNTPNQEALNHRKSAFTQSFLLTQEVLSNNQYLNKEQIFTKEKGLSAICTMLEKTNIACAANTPEEARVAGVNLKKAVNQVRLELEGNPCFRPEHSLWRKALIAFTALASIVLAAASVACPPLLAPAAVLFTAAVAVGVKEYKRDSKATKEEELSKDAALSVTALTR